MKLSTLTLAVSLTLAACYVGGVMPFSAEAAETATQNAEDISKVNGSIKVAAGSVAGEVSTVNGSINVAEDSQVKSASTVNGSITLAERAQVTGETSTVNGSIKLASGSKVMGELSTVNGDMVINSSTVAGDVSTVNGTLKIEGSQIAGNLTTLNGNVSLLAGSVVQGDLVYAERTARKSWFSWFGKDKHKPATLTISADSNVQGQIILKQEVNLKLENTALAARVVKQYTE
ncbi:hypothetical protein [Alishewanella sp. SMS8]|uniref:hypothetical protein n=1 Tax=Alishewanella sp. SMS8 TaxID=2994676 RepID=UPI002741FE89|nr:hypothetical protein [Alishewanella sp. SMS8]MDP5207488.1 hypothetical protein [Alishewanella sp. SMS9]MDP5459024.1 hypothetical protein [Alishewanella sp. SMS8]